MSYVSKIMKREELSVRAIKRCSTLSDNEIFAKALRFHTSVFKHLPFVDGVINIDEIPQSMSGRMGAFQSRSPFVFSSIIENLLLCSSYIFTVFVHFFFNNRV